MHRSYFTIAEIMLVIAVTAIFLSASRAIVQERELAKGIEELLVLRAVSGTVIGAIIGVGIGSSRRRRFAGAVWGFLGGGAMGGVAATFLSLPQNIPLALIGSAVLVVGGIAVRVLSRRATEDGDS